MGGHRLSESPSQTPLLQLRAGRWLWGRCRGVTVRRQLRRRGGTSTHQVRWPGGSECLGTCWMEGSWPDVWPQSTWRENRRAKVSGGERQAERPARMSLA